MNINITPELIGICISIMTSLLTLAYIFGGVVKRLDRVEKDVEKFDKKFDKKFDIVNQTLSDINRRLGVVEGTLSVAGNSPLQLTSGGKEIVNDLAADDFINNNYTSLKEFVLKNKHESKYDIQVLSSNAVSSLLPEDEMKKYKDYAYKKGWKLEHVFDAIGLVLRDRILLDIA